MCEAALQESRKGGGDLLGKIDHAIQNGFAWLASNFTMRHNPGFAAPPQSWPHYTMYSVERACELSRVAWLQDRDWYFEGAMLLIENQLASGEFGAAGFDGTCFAVLFLKKAALPAITGGR